MNIQITDLPPGRQVKRILVDITFDDESIPEPIICELETESIPEPIICELETELEKHSDMVNIPNTDNTRDQKPIPDEMRDLEI